MLGEKKSSGYVHKVCLIQSMFSVLFNILVWHEHYLAPQTDTRIFFFLDFQQECKADF